MLIVIKQNLNTDVLNTNRYCDVFIVIVYDERETIAKIL